METFDAAWLALREPIDQRSRAELLLEPLCEAWRARGWTRVLDLGSGTGANFRYMAPRLPVGQAWVLVDHDPYHVRELGHLSRPDSVTELTVMSGDVAEEGLTAAQDADLVTASAMLDLVSEAWLHRIVDCCASEGRGAYFALSYNGEVEWVPLDERERSAETDVDDAFVRTAVNAHQLRDKGLGPALGPMAGRTAERLFQGAGYRTRLVLSPWRLAIAETPVADRLIEGWAAAAAEVQPDEAARVRGWADRRREDVTRGRVMLTVGHCDLLALPADRL